MVKEKTRITLVVRQIKDVGGIYHDTIQSNKVPVSVEVTADSCFGWDDITKITFLSDASSWKVGDFVDVTIERADDES